MNSRFRRARAGLYVGALVLLGATACIADAGGPTPTTAPNNTGPDCSPPSFHQGSNFGAGCSLAGLTITGVDLSPDPSGQGPSGGQTYAPEANIAGTAFVDSNLSGANFKYVHGHGASFIRSNLSGSNWPGSGSTSLSDLTATHWDTVDATNAGFQYADFSGADLTDVRLEGASLMGSVWTGATLSGVTLDATTTCPDGAAFDSTTLCRGTLPGF